MGNIKYVEVGIGGERHRYGVPVEQAKQILLRRLPKTAQLPGRVDLLEVTEAGIVLSGNSTASLYLVDNQGVWTSKSPTYRWTCEQHPDVQRQHTIRARRAQEARESDYVWRITMGNKR